VSDNDDLNDPFERQRRYERKKAARAAEVGDIPAVADPARREACRLNLRLFLITYFPASTGLSPFSEDHERVIGRIQGCVLDGGLFVQAVYRGFAKTTISENSSIWATVYGHRKFVPIFGADAGAAEGNIDSVKLELAENDLLYEDFPEVCHAIRALEGKPQRCASQTHDGVLTHIEWRADTIVLPTIPNSPASGAIITARGIESGCRGMKHKRPDGTQQRPDFVILDDPQTDRSAATQLQVEKRLNIIRKSILRLGGHGRKIAVVMNATVIEPDDLVVQLLDPKKSPAWQGERIRMVRRWAGGRPVEENKVRDWKGPDTHERLWLGDYARLRNTYDPNVLGDQQRAHRAATAFYERNRPLMDAGCEVSWDQCFDRNAERSAIQHAYNILIDDGPDVFASECQNDPLRDDADGGEDQLSAEQIAAKVGAHERGDVPESATHLVAFVDVQKNLLYWMVAGVADDFTGDVVDYGVFPEQKQRKYFAAADAKNTLAKVYGGDGAGLEEVLYAGLDALVGDLMARDWRRGDGAVLKPERILVDANWGESTDVVYQFCRQSPHAAVLMPSHGRGIGATSRPLNDYKPKAGDRVGQQWRMPAVKGRRSVRYVIFDANAWKSFMHSRLRAGRGARGCWSLFAPVGPDDHKLLADHLTAEQPVDVEAKGRKVVEWKVRPGRPDNHWFDGLVGCGVAASIQGASLKEVAHRAPAKPAGKRVRLSELQKQKARK
jgi:hypothetical protein